MINLEKQFKDFFGCHLEENHKIAVDKCQRDLFYVVPNRTLGEDIREARLELL